MFQHLVQYFHAHIRKTNRMLSPFNTKFILYIQINHDIITSSSQLGEILYIYIDPAAIHTAYPRVSQSQSCFSPETYTTTAPDVRLASSFVRSFRAVIPRRELQMNSKLFECYPARFWFTEHERNFPACHNCFWCARFRMRACKPSSSSLEKYSEGC